MQPPTIKPVSDSALLLEFENKIDRSTNQQVLAVQRRLAGDALDGVVEIVPSYRSLLIHYDCTQIGLERLQNSLLELLASYSAEQETQRLWRVPVCYGGDAGCDLDEVAGLHELDTNEVIRLHSTAEFRIYMIGFAPGWCYLGGLPEALHTPRLESPRLRVPRGCIPIGGQQGLIGALPMPSGWRLLGQTPVRSYMPGREPAFLFAPGDEIRFYAIDAKEYASLDKAAERGELLIEAETL